MKKIKSMINNRISSNQLAILSFLLFMAPLAFMRSNDLNNNIADSVFSFITVVFITLLLSVPVFMRKGILSENRFINVLYSFYFVFIIITDITAVTKMLVNTIIPEGNSSFIAFSTLLIAVYGALKGNEAVGRCAEIVFFFFILGAGFIILSAIWNVRPEEYVIPFENGFSDYIDNTVLIFSAVSFIPMVAVLKEDTEGKFTLKYFIYMIAALVVGVAFLLETQFCLGYYALTQQYPIYTLSAVTKAEPLKRLDLIFTVIFIMASVMRTAVSFLCIFKLSSQSFKKYGNIIKISYLIIASILCTIFLNFEKVINFQLIVYLRAFLLIMFSLPVPILLKLSKKRRTSE